MFSTEVKVLINSEVETYDAGYERYELINALKNNDAEIIALGSGFDDYDIEGVSDLMSILELLDEFYEMDLDIRYDSVYIKELIELGIDSSRGIFIFTVGDYETIGEVFATYNDIADVDYEELGKGLESELIKTTNMWILKLDI